jgi:hypothetical protein
MAFGNGMAAYQPFMLCEAQPCCLIKNGTFDLKRAIFEVKNSAVYSKTINM